MSLPTNKAKRPATPERVRVEACAALVDRAAERWLDERVRGQVTPARERELDDALAEYRAARAREAK